MKKYGIYLKIYNPREANENVQCGKTNYSREALDFFETVSLPAEDEKTQAIIMDFPTVYIHNWQDSGAFEVYVGETNNIFKRT